MNRGLPSMTALLGLLAIAGYQNKDKLAEMFGGGGAAPGTGNVPPNQPGALGQSANVGHGSAAGQQGGLGGLLGSLGGLLGGAGPSATASTGAGAGVGGLLSGGLSEMMERFKQSGHGDVADSWVGTGPNKEVAPHQLEQAIGPDVLATLTQHTGLSREELISRLTRELPNAVDKYTPEGRLPA
jgi:uncharacterized protein YidB (DUF937 family)